MPSKVQIVNLALRKIGAQRITSFDEGTKAADLATDTFDMILDGMISAHTWNFATVRATLPVLTTTPAWGFLYEYNLPAKPYCLRVMRIDNTQTYDDKWKVEGRKIVCNIDTTIDILYLQRFRTYGNLPPSFVEAFAYKIAMEWALDLTGTSGVENQLEREYLRKIIEARSVDGQEGIADTLEASSFIQSRQS